MSKPNLEKRYEKPLMDVVKEIGRQYEKWGIQKHTPEMWIVILTEELGEVCKASLEAKYSDWSKQEYRKEMVQVAAVALSAIEYFDRTQSNNP